VAIGTTHWLKEVWPDLQPQQLVETFQTSNNLGIKVLVVLAAVVIAPLAEETLFRGFVYGVLKRYTDAPFAALAQDIKPRLIRFGYGLVENSNQGRAVKVFAEQVEKASGGKMRVRAVGAAALGPDVQMQQALIGGAQEMMVGSTATLVGITKEGRGVFKAGRAEEANKVGTAGSGALLGEAFKF
jgi:TRAP-type C4-dicarboxylate transport system substrate-binding protein